MVRGAATSPVGERYDSLHAASVNHAHSEDLSMTAVSNWTRGNKKVLSQPDRRLIAGCEEAARIRYSVRICQLGAEWQIGG